MSEANSSRHISETYLRTSLYDGMHALMNDPSELGDVPEGYDTPGLQLALHGFRAGTFFLNGNPYHRVTVEQSGNDCFYVRLHTPDWEPDFLPTVLIDSEGNALVAGIVDPALSGEVTQTEYLLFVLQNTDFNIIDTKIYEERLRENAEFAARITREVEEARAE
jgi:hypothetical protein